MDTRERPEGRLGLNLWPTLFATVFLYTVFLSQIADPL
jgi:hypothetical protein